MTHAITFSEIEKKALIKGVNCDVVRELFNKRDDATPILIMSRSEIRKNYDDLVEALPRVKIHYAVKPNAHEVIISEVYKRGGNFDVCSEGEIKKVLKTGIDPKTLIHSHPIKSKAEFDFAVNAGLETFVVDNPDEIEKFKRYNKKLKVLIRFRINTNTTAVVNLQYKFGCHADDVLSLAQKIKETGHEYYGLSFHIGSQCGYSENYIRAIEKAHELIDQLEEAGLKTSLLDIGGGFPVEYAEPIMPIKEFCEPIAEALDLHIREDIKIISEPGRFIAASPTTLICTIVGKSERDGKMWYYLDDGLYSTFSGIVFDHCQYPVVSSRSGDDQLLSVLAGPTCDSFDVMYDGLMLAEHFVGDKLLFTYTGAYCEVSGSSFNSLKRPEYLIID